jgi:hypothetical protein
LSKSEESMAERLLIAFCVMLLLAAPAAAQSSPEEQLPDECQAQPRSDGSGQGDSGQPSSPDGLTEKLDPCNGVLRPPPVGDQEITEPPPDTGTTPIIPPGDVPPQPRDEQ